MANYRQIHVSIWKDEWFLELDPKEKLLFIYLFSNESSSLAGIYKIPIRVIAFETCLDIEFIKMALEKFAEAGKVYFENGVFEPFFSTKTGGSGLGLALVKKIAEDHGGGVWLHSGPDGTRVALWLPAAGETGARPVPGTTAGPA